MASTDGDSLGNRGAAGGRSSSLDREGGLASFGERMALVMHKWTWQHLFKTTAQKRSERPRGCQGRRRPRPVKYAAPSSSTAYKKVHYADFQASQIQWFFFLFKYTWPSSGHFFSMFLFQRFINFLVDSLLLLLPLVCFFFQCLSSR